MVNFTGNMGSDGTAAVTGTNLGSTEGSQSDLMSRETLTFLTRLYGYISLSCFTFGLLLNTLSVNFFYSRRKSLSNMMYCIISITDMMVSILMLFYTLPHLVGFRDPVMFSSEPFCKVWTVDCYMGSYFKEHRGPGRGSWSLQDDRSAGPI